MYLQAFPLRLLRVVLVLLAGSALVYSLCVG